MIASALEGQEDTASYVALVVLHMEVQVISLIRWVLLDEKSKMSF